MGRITRDAGKRNQEKLTEKGNYSKARLAERKELFILATGTLIALLCIMIIVALVGIPIYRRYTERAADYACSLAVDKAQDYIDMYYLGHDFSLTLEEAQAEVERSLYGREDTVCPDGGDFLIYEDPTRDMPYVVACALHDSDIRQRTRLRAGGVLIRVREAVERQQRLGNLYPESVTVPLNSHYLVCTLVQEPTNLKHGTIVTDEYTGIVAFYALAGNSSLSSMSQKEGEVSYFSFADENYCANWTYGTGWSGDSWDD